jgi:hypothetical protein
MKLNWKCFTPMLRSVSSSFVTMSTVPPHDVTAGAALELACVVVEADPCTESVRNTIRVAAYLQPVAHPGKRIVILERSEGSLPLLLNS